jgi:hypothetical protein
MASAMGLRQALPKQTKRTRSFLGGFITTRIFSQKCAQDANYGLSGCELSSVRGNHLQKVFVDGGVAREFGMKCGGEEILVLNEDGLARIFGENIESGAGTFDDGAADENHFERVGLQFGRAEENVAGDLAAVGVAKNGHVHEAKRGLGGIFDFGGEKNCASTCTENGAAGVCEIANCVVEAFFLEELKLRGAFAARKDETIALFEVGDSANFERFRGELAQARRVGLEVTLNGENSYLQTSLG